MLNHNHRPLLIAVFFIAALPLIGLAQQAPESVWQQTYSHDGSSCAMQHIALTPADGIMIAADRLVWDEYYGFWRLTGGAFWALDETGAVLGHYPGVAGSRYEEIRFVSDLECLAVTHLSGDYTPSIDTISRFHLSEDGNAAFWSFSPDNEFGNDCRAMLVYGDGANADSLVAWYTVYDWDDYYGDIGIHDELHTFDPDGTSLSEIDTDFASDGHLVEVIVDEQGNRMLLSQDGPTVYQLTLVGPDDTLIAQTTHTIDGAEFAWLRMTQAANGDVLVWADGLNDNYSAVLARHDAQGHEIWSTIMPTEHITNVMESDSSDLLVLLEDRDLFNGTYEWQWVDPLDGSLQSNTALDGAFRFLHDACLLPSGDILVVGEDRLHDPERKLGVAMLFSTDGSSVPQNGNTSRPLAFRLSPVYPNPFNPTTTVKLDLPDPSPLSVTVYDLLGRPVSVLHDGPTTQGQHAFTFDATGLSSGTYLLRARAGDEILIRRITLVK